jgi:hypothetical protein
MASRTSVRPRMTVSATCDAGARRRQPLATAWVVGHGTAAALPAPRLRALCDGYILNSCRLLAGPGHQIGRSVAQPGSALALAGVGSSISA